MISINYFKGLIAETKSSIIIFLIKIDSMVIREFFLLILIVLLIIMLKILVHSLFGLANKYELTGVSGISDPRKIELDIIVQLF